MTSIGPIGLFGGNFDPVHNGHLAIVDAAQRHLRLAGVLWVPTGLPGHREVPVAAAEHREAMLRLAIEGRRGNHVDPAELKRGAQGLPTYTIDTLRRLREDAAAWPRLTLIIGSDQFMALDTWREWQGLFDLAHIAVAERPGHGIDDTRLGPALRAHWKHRRCEDIPEEKPSGCVVRFPMTPMEVSSTGIRQVLSAKGDARQLLPAKVLDYIYSHRLYESEGPP